VVWRNVVSISSTGFPKVYEFVEDLEFHVIVLERLGDSLLHVWRKLDFNFSTATIAQVGIDLIGVLQFIHELGYLVRNLCPGHVLVQPNGGLALIDFTQVAKTMLNKRPL
jgi:serine/threonine protein kinase